MILQKYNSQLLLRYIVGNGFVVARLLEYWGTLL